MLAINWASSSNTPSSSSSSSPASVNPCKIYSQLNPTFTTIDWFHSLFDNMCVVFFPSVIQSVENLRTIWGVWTSQLNLRFTVFWKMPYPNITPQHGHTSQNSFWSGCAKLQLCPRVCQPSLKVIKCNEVMDVKAELQMRRFRHFRGIVFCGSKELPETDLVHAPIDM